MRGQVALIPISILTWGSTLFIIRLGAPLVGLFEFNFLLYTTGASIISVTIALRKSTSTSVGRRTVLYPAAAAATEVGANTAFLLALEHMPISIVAPAMSTYVIVTVILAMIVLRERQTVLRTTGILLAVAGVSLLTLPATTAGSGSISVEGALLLGATIILRGVWNFIIKLGVPAVGLNRFLKHWLILSAIMSIPPLLLFSSGFVLSSAILYPVAAAALMVFGSLAYFAAIERFPLGLVAPATSLGPGFTVVLAIIFLGEALTIFQGIGAVVAILGVALIAR